MKTIYLVRHATAINRTGPTPDFERPLVKKGIKESNKMAKILALSGSKPEIFISSPANRALETAEIFARKFKCPKEKIILESDFYESMSGQTFINAIKKLDNKKSSVILFGHEPTISEFAAYLVKSFRQGIPKAGIIGIDIESSSWVNIAKEKGTIKFVQYPKSISEAQQLMKKSIAVKIEAEISKLLENVDAETAGRVSKSVKKSSKEITKIFLKKYQKKQQEKKPSKP